MKITDIKTTQVTIPFAKFGKFTPIKMWYMTRYSNFQKTVTFIITDEGITGISCGGDQETIMNKIRPKIIGMDPFDLPHIERINPANPYDVITYFSIKEENEMKKWGGVTARRYGFANVAAIDCALWDIIGKKCNQPLYKIWGGKYHDIINVRYWLSCDTPENMSAESIKALERGWKAFKIKIGTHPDEDLERVQAIRDAVGNNIELNFDINGGYSLSRAMRALKNIIRYDPASIEEPISNSWPWDQHSIEGMAFLRKVIGVPIEAHCHGPNIEEFVRLLIEKEAADFLHTRPGFAGPVMQCKRLIAMADMGGIKATCQSSAAELGPENAYHLHWITSSPEFTGTNDNSTHLLEPPSWDIINNEFKTINGTLKVPEGPGLGVELDPVKLAQSEELSKQGKYSHEKGLGQKDKYYWG